MLGSTLQELCKTLNNIAFGILPFIKGSFSITTSSTTYGPHFGLEGYPTMQDGKIVIIAQQLLTYYEVEVVQHMSTCIQKCYTVPCPFIGC